MLAQNLMTKKLTTTGGTVTGAGVPGKLWGFAIQYGTAAISGVTFKDGGSSGTEKYAWSHVAVTAATDLTEGQVFPIPIHFSNDIYATLTGTGVVLWVLYTLS